MRSDPALQLPPASSQQNPVWPTQLQDRQTPETSVQLKASSTGYHKYGPVLPPITGLIHDGRKETQPSVIDQVHGHMSDLPQQLRETGPFRTPDFSANLNSIASARSKASQRPAQTTAQPFVLFDKPPTSQPESRPITFPSDDSLQVSGCSCPLCSCKGKLFDTPIKLRHHRRFAHRTSSTVDKRPRLGLTPEKAVSGANNQEATDDCGMEMG
ncbi:hypothetical protein BT63DRAFT_78553 [Microthyrium microscopicum]|uniref:Uncharacterized protein n=1 Tax=Microthyrium microscopicum TaxID=703497 RepID=A0A6A6U1R2_9PEZI|nr:hypothetical protein BT63DRAFT_78553 [Microthyrium microscopicum]